MKVVDKTIPEQSFTSFAEQHDLELEINERSVGLRRDMGGYAGRGGHERGGAAGEGAVVGRRVYKYPLPIGDVVSIEMPRRAELLHVHAHDNQLCVWAAVFPQDAPVSRSFRIAETGHELNIQHDAKYVGTAHVMDGRIVLHVFDLGEP